MYSSSASLLSRLVYPSISLGLRQLQPLRSRIPSVCSPLVAFGPFRLRLHSCGPLPSVALLIRGSFAAGYRPGSLLPGRSARRSGSWPDECAPFASARFSAINEHVNRSFGSGLCFIVPVAPSIPERPASADPTQRYASLPKEQCRYATLRSTRLRLTHRRRRR